MTINGDDFSFFDLDEHALDREWVRQSRLYFDHAKQVAEVERQVKELEAELDVGLADIKNTMEIRAAEVDRDVRAFPEKFGLEKVREEAIKNCITLDNAYQKYQREYGALKHELSLCIAKKQEELGILKAACKALDHRKQALENLVDLWAASYYAEPKASGEGSKKIGDTVTINSTKKASARIKRKERDRD